MSSVDLFRERMDHLLQEMQVSDFSLAKNHHIINKLFIDNHAENHPLYAWVPIPTAICPSELGTTSDQCSSYCGVGSCSKRNKDSEDTNDKNDDSTPWDQNPPSPRPRFSENRLSSNPF